MRGWFQAFVKTLSNSIGNLEDGKQLISSGSVGANYIEANESLGRKDFMMKIKTCRRDTKETRSWFRLVEPDQEQEQGRSRLVNETDELMKIFDAIFPKSEER